MNLIWQVLGGVFVALVLGLSVYHWEKLSSEVQAALIGSAVPLVGVIITAVVTFNVFRLQRRGEDEQKDRDRLAEDQRKALDRKLQLKRDVYLEAADGIISGMAILGEMVDPKPTQQDVASRFLACRIAIAKASLVADEKTLKEINKFSLLMQQTFNDLFLFRQSLVGHHQKVEFCKNQIAQAGLSLHRQDGSFPTVQVVEDTFRRIDQLEKDRDTESDRAQQTTVEMIRFARDRFPCLNEMLLPVFAAVRSELGQDTDEADYKATVAKMSEWGNKAVDDLLKNFDRGSHPPKDGTATSGPSSGIESPQGIQQPPG